jgi:hypothetical protein
MTAYTIPRDVLARALNNDQRAMAAFEQIAQVVGETEGAVITQAEATEALQDATVLVLSPNATFTNERVLRLGEGLRAYDDGTNLTIAVDDDVPHVQGGFEVTLTAQAVVNLVLPAAGIIATQDQEETLAQKTLSAPRLINVPNYADDAAAATGGIDIGQMYRTGNALKVRIA